MTQELGNSDYDRADLLFTQRRPKDAIDYLHRALAKNPGDVRALALLSVCHTNLGEHKKALEIARAALASDPNHAYSHYAHAISLWNSTRQHDAQTAIKMAEQISPYESIYPKLHAFFLTQLRNYPQALKTIERALSIAPYDADAHAQHARILLADSKPDKAHEAAISAVSLGPENPAAHAALGAAHLAKLRHAEAGAALRESLRLNPQELSVRLELVEALCHRTLLFRLVVRPMERVIGFVDRFTPDFIRGKGWMIFLLLCMTVWVTQLFHVGFTLFVAFLGLMIACVWAARRFLKQLAVFLLQRDAEVRPLLHDARRRANFVVFTVLALPIIVAMIIGAFTLELPMLGLIGVPMFMTVIFYASVAMSCWPEKNEMKFSTFLFSLGAAALPGAIIFALMHVGKFGSSVGPVLGPIAALMIAVTATQNKKNSL